MIFAKTKWEALELPLPEFLRRARDEGFSATEINLAELKESPEEIRALHAVAGLEMVVQILTAGATPSEHAACMRQRYRSAVECAPLIVNCHTGRDFFTFEENLALFRLSLELEQESGIPFCHELHRGRAFYNAPETLRTLRELPALRINADFSHWQVVHESDDLQAHSEAIQAVIDRAWHIHARVGFSEGPQIPDPGAPEWAPQLGICVDWWRRIIDARRAQGAPFLTVAPEFGPEPYMPMVPHLRRPLADAWEINCWMRRYLATAFAENQKSEAEQGSDRVA
ncbi:MAG: hypothetical protein ABSE87_09330 [Terracidiphilus sp.]